MKLKHLLNLFFSLVLLLTTLGCGNDDNAIDLFNPCIETLSGWEDIILSDFSIQVIDEPDNRGYLITATITNNSQESRNGFPHFVFRANRIFSTYSTSNSASASSCLDIEASSSCNFSTAFTFFDQEENIDPNPEFLCFYYSKF